MEVQAKDQRERDGLGNMTYLMNIEGWDRREKSDLLIITRCTQQEKVLVRRYTARSYSGKIMLHMIVASDCAAQQVRDEMEVTTYLSAVPTLLLHTNTPFTHFEHF